MTDPCGYGAQAGYSTDRETGLLLLTHRYYDPAAGRFLNRDPIGYAGGINLYAYVGNNPGNLLDPSGLTPGHLWNERLAEAIDMGAEYQKGLIIDHWARGKLGIAIATGACTPIDYVKNSALGILNFGKGTGAFVGDPSVENLPGLAGDALVGAGLLGGARGALAARRGAGGAVPTECFPAGTPILTPEGENPIEQIRAGAVVLSANPGTGEQSYQRVTRTFQRVKDGLLRIETADGRSIRSTEEHPFWVEGKGFIAAKRLARSDLLRDTDGDRVRVERVTWLPGRVTVYNFEVEGTHTYFAGGYWVHNQCPKPLGPPGDAGSLGLSRMDRFRNLAESGFRTESGFYGINPHVLNSLRKSGRLHIDPESMVRALNGPSVPGMQNSRVFTDPVTGNRFFVNPENQVVGVHPAGFR